MAMCGLDPGGVAVGGPEERTPFAVAHVTRVAHFTRVAHVDVALFGSAAGLLDLGEFGEPRAERAPAAFDAGPREARRLGRQQVVDRLAGQFAGVGELGPDAPDEVDVADGTPENLPCGGR